MLYQVRENWVWLAAGVPAVAAVAFAAFTIQPGQPPEVAEPSVAVVALGSDDTTAGVAFTGDLGEALEAVGAANGAVELSLPNGTEVVDFAPRYGRSMEVDQSPERRQAAIEASIDTLRSRVDETDGSGRDVLEALDRAATVTAPEVWVLANPLSVTSPADFRATGLGGVTPEELTASIAAAGYTPELSGKEVRFLAVPAAGQQPRLRPVDRQWVEEVWLGVMREAGATASFQWLDSGSAVSTLPGPVLAVPTVTTITGGACTLDASYAFKPDSAEFLTSREEVASGLAECASSLAPTGQITVTGHVAKVIPECVPCGVELSRQRARAVAAILIDLGVAANRLVVDGVGSAQPLDPTRPDAPENRRVDIESAS